MEQKCVYRIEGIPLIIRFKTANSFESVTLSSSIEGIPLIIRFKTPYIHYVHETYIP